MVLSKLLKAMTIALLLIACSQVFLAFSACAVPTYTLEVEIDGKGRITVTPDKSHHEEGTLVTLLATPASGWIFDYLSGRVGDKLFISRTPEITINMTGDATVKAHFHEIPTYTLEVERDGKGRITVTPDKSHHEEGTLVTLLATPASGWIFVGWSVRIGDHRFITWLPEITITMTADANANALFIPFGAWKVVRALGNY